MTSSSSHVITEYGKQNIFGRETPPQLVDNYTSHLEEARKKLMDAGQWLVLLLY